MPKTTTKAEEVAQAKASTTNLDTPTNFLNMTLRQIFDWEARHRQFCRTAHRQPCDCDPWE